MLSTADMGLLLRCSSVVAAAWVTAGIALAREPIGLEWAAPEICPTREEVLARANALLGQTESSHGVVARGRIRATEDGFELELETEGADETRGVRRLRAAQCRDLAQPAALLLALAVDPNVAAGEPATPEPSPEPVVEPPTPISAEPEPPTASPRPLPPVEAPERSPAIALRLLVGIVGDLGTLPSAAPGLSGGIGAALGRITVDARGTFLFEQRAEIGGGRGGDFTLVTGGVVVCYGLNAEAVVIAPCVGAEAGLLSGTGFGVRDPGSGSALWLAAILGLRGSLSLTEQLGAWVSAELVVPMGRPDFVLENVGPVHQPAPVAGRAALGLELRFP
jgi:hypothetical protein